MRHLSGEQREGPKHCLILFQNDLSSNVTVAIDRRQFIHVPKNACAAEERPASGCRLNKDLKVAEHNDDWMSSYWC